MLAKSVSLLSLTSSTQAKTDSMFLSSRSSSLWFWPHSPKTHLSVHLLGPRRCGSIPPAESGGSTHWDHSCHGYMRGFQVCTSSRASSLQLVLRWESPFCCAMIEQEPRFTNVSFWIKKFSSCLFSVWDKDPEPHLTGLLNAGTLKA